MTEQSFYRWRQKYGGLEVSDAKRLREFMAENVRLKRIVAELLGLSRSTLQYSSRRTPDTELRERLRALAAGEKVTANARSR